jgi:hypothetical protein
MVGGAIKAFFKRVGGLPQKAGQVVGDHNNRT